MDRRDTSGKHNTAGRLIMLTLGCALVIGNLVVGIQTGGVSYFIAAGAFGLMTILWNEWAPANIFARPIHAVSDHPLTSSQKWLVIGGSVLIIVSVVVRWTVEG